jgi:hypothetical protein
MPRPLGRDHADVDAGGRIDLPEMDREAVSEHQQVALGDAVLDLLLPDLGLLLVREQNHHDVAATGRVGDLKDLEAGLLGLAPRGRVRPQADHNVVGGLLQVEGMRVPLRAEAEDRDRLPRERVGVGVGVVEDS